MDTNQTWGLSGGGAVSDCAPVFFAIFAALLCVLAVKALTPQSVLDFFVRKLQLQSQGIREAVGEVGEARQHVDVHDLGIGEMLL